MCKCNNVELGSYDNQVTLKRPEHMQGRQEGSSGDTICVDACIENEIKWLWELGVHTTGCCCGHNKIDGFIGVIDSDIDFMLELGYTVQKNPNRPDSKDTFNLIAN